MHLDGFFFNALTQELNTELSGSRVEDVYTTQAGNLLIQVRAPGKTLRLEASVTAPPFAFFLTREGQREKVPNVFAQTLRKQLVGLFCISVVNPPFDRRGVISFSTSPTGQADTYVYIEIMGRQNDIILCQGDTIVASTRPPQRESIRPLQAGERYTPPPPAAKLVPQNLTWSLLATLFQNMGSLELKKALVNGVFGISPLLAEEICHRARISPIAPAKELTPAALAPLAQIILDLASASTQGRYYPVIYPQQGPYWTILEHVSPQPRECPSLSGALADWNTYIRSSSGTKSVRTRLQSLLTAASRKLERTLAKQEQELQKAKEFEHLRQIGDTLLTAIHTIPRGAMSVTLDNVHTGQTMTIPLDPEKSASANASYYYKRYNKYKNALAVVKEQMRRNEEQLDYLSSLEYAVESALSLSDLQEIEQEMQEQNLVRTKARNKVRAKSGEEFLTYKTPQGHLVMVGKNNRQNEVLTLKKADKSHFWLHTRHFPGSHVILCTANPDEETLEYAASLAAWHSKARSSPKVEVVWTQVKNVKKIPGAKPGMVQYSDYRSGLIEPRPHSNDEAPQ